MTFFQKSKKEKPKGKAPDHISPLGDGKIGVAVWTNDDGDHDVKIGEASHERRKPMFVRSTVPLSYLRQQARAIQTVAETFANNADAGVPGDIRSDLADLARRLEAALDTPVDEATADASQGNGLFG